MVCGDEPLEYAGSKVTNLACCALLLLLLPPADDGAAGRGKEDMGGKMGGLGEALILDEKSPERELREVDGGEYCS